MEGAAKNSAETETTLLVVGFTNGTFSLYELPTFETSKKREKKQKRNRCDEDIKSRNILQNRKKRRNKDKKSSRNIKKKTIDGKNEAKHRVLFVCFF